MTSAEIYELMNSNPFFHLATLDRDTPRVRGMMLFKAGPDGIYFHSGTFKALHKQIVANSRAELCFFDPKSGTQVRVNGNLEIVEGDAMKLEMVNHPSRAFLKKWMEDGDAKEFLKKFSVYRLHGGTATVWTFATNFEPQEWNPL
jgi:uncharacterized pyridoxamine 5'-phosphate oxidase family protein